MDKNYQLPRVALFLLSSIMLLLSMLTVAHAAEQLDSGFTAFYPKTPQHYLAMSKTAPRGERETYQLKAAGRYLQDHDFMQAHLLLGSINTRELPEHLVDEKLLLEANLAMMQNQGKKSLDLLAHISSPSRLPQSQMLAYYQILSIAYLQTDHPLASAEVKMRLDPLLPNSEAQQHNREAIWANLYQLSNRSLASELRNAAYGEVRGWIEIVYITKQYKDDPKVYNNEVRRWQQHNPQHPANKLVEPKSRPLFSWPRATPKSNYGSGTRFGRVATVSGPPRVALLLPMSGPLADSGQAIKSGFMAAYYKSKGDTNTPESIEVYNTNDGDVASLYRKAVSDGANLVIGPLTKRNVQLIERMGNLSVPTLALNTTPSNGQALDNFFEYSLSPQDEAVQAGVKAWKNGLTRALVIIPADDWGRGIAEKFEASLKNQGGKVIDTLEYSSKTNMDQSIKHALEVNKSSKRSDDLIRLLGKKIESTPQRRQDVDMVFLVATAEKAREINPLLKFYYANDLPVYATSQVYSGEPDKMKDKDLNGIQFCDMPWTLRHTSKIQKEKNQMQELMPDMKPQYSRLYAFGYDAYTLGLNLSRNPKASYSNVKGVTGTLYLGQNQHVFRQLEWATFKDGIPS